jgi:hypothetical protein
MCISVATGCVSCGAKKTRENVHFMVSKCAVIMGKIEGKWLIFEQKWSVWTNCPDVM